ncbi:unnamed protein product [Adineta steineri]|uniref:Ion transport domain-containing protein n=1 Tax=Adineta steineri TaxID=433720 RepID=A0A819TLT6_9BILA|nr:unnamed protein product [Adineta steineri]
MDNGIDAVDGFLFLICFVGVVVENFHNCRVEQEIEEKVRNKLKREKKLKHQQYLINNLPYYANFSSTRKYLHDLFIAIIIILNVITMSIVMEKMKNKYIIPINPTLTLIVRISRITRRFFIFSSFFIFATLEVELFGRLECNEEQLCSAIDKHANFQNFGIVLLTLFRIATGDNWNSIMKDTLRQDDLSYTNKYHFITIISPIYFVIFILMA